VLINGKQTVEAMLVDGDRLDVGAFTFLFLHCSSKPPNVFKPAPNASIVVDGAPIPIPFGMRTLLIGRRSCCDIHLTEASVSNGHALIFERNGACWIRDLYSRTRTFVNGVAVHQKQLALDDELRIGGRQMRYIESAAATGHLDELEDLASPAPTPSQPTAVANPAAPVRASEEPIPLASPAEAGPVSETFAADDIPRAIPVEEVPAADASHSGAHDLIPHAALTTEAEPALNEIALDDLPLAPVDGSHVEVSSLAADTGEPITVADDVALPEASPADRASGFGLPHAIEVASPTIDGAQSFGLLPHPSPAPAPEPLLPPHAMDDGFAAAIADELHPDAAPASIESPVELDAAPQPTPAESAMEDVHEQMADLESLSDTGAGFAIELAPSPSDVEFDELIADELHPEMASAETPFLPDIEARHPDAIPRETAVTADPPFGDSHEVVSPQTAEEFDQLIAGELHPEAVPRVVQLATEVEIPDVDSPSPVSIEEEKISLDGPTEFGTMASSPEFDELIAGELEVTRAGIEPLTDVGASRCETATIESDSTEEAGVGYFAGAAPPAACGEYGDLVSVALNSASQLSVVEAPSEVAEPSQQFARIETALEMPIIVEPAAEHPQYSEDFSFEDLIVAALRPQTKREGSSGWWLPSVLRRKGR
jgi:hypothetical protein